MLNNIKNEILSEASEYIDSNWERVFSEMQQIFMFSSKACREGILILEDYLEELQNHDLKYFLSLVVDGIDGKLIEEYMENLYRSNPRHGLEGLLYLIDAYGALFIQSGNSNRYITGLFKSLVPTSHHKDIVYREDIVLMEQTEKIKEALAKGTLSDVIVFTPTEDSFSQTILALPEIEFTILQKKVCFDEGWDAALKYSDPQLIARIFNDSHTSTFVYKMDAINYRHTKEDSDKAKEKILAALDKIKRKIKMAAEGRASEAFNLVSTEDDFSARVTGLSDEQLKQFIIWADEGDLINALDYTTPDVLNKIAVGMDTEKLFAVYGRLEHRSPWSKKEADKSKKRLLAVIRRIRNFS